MEEGIGWLLMFLLELVLVGTGKVVIAIASSGVIFYVMFLRDDCVLLGSTAFNFYFTGRQPS